MRALWVSGIEEGIRGQQYLKPTVFPVAIPLLLASTVTGDEDE
ncbi:MAG: hypothetical protein VX173_08955 [Pseudomonadota bacterium]|nr:hypothetical protein [Pseudomonadota bacterium]